mgnify:CR=1 FL=1
MLKSRDLEVSKFLQEFPGAELIEDTISTPTETVTQEEVVPQPQVLQPSPVNLEENAEGTQGIPTSTPVDQKTKKEEIVGLENYTERFDEWRIAKNAVQGPFISAGDKISGFSFNSKSLYKLRLWLFIIIFPIVIWWLGLLSIVWFPIYAWYNILGFTTFQSEHLASISTLSLSFFVVIRIYSHCTNNRNLPLNSNIFSNYDNYVTKHLFKLPKSNSLPITLKALLLDFLIGWLILILIMGLTTFENTVCSPAEVYSFDSLEFMTLLILMLSVAVFTPIIEELVFRGFVLDVASEAYGKWGAIFGGAP